MVAFESRRTPDAANVSFLSQRCHQPRNQSIASPLRKSLNGKS